MMTQLALNSPVYSFLPSIKDYIVSKSCVFPFGFRKGKTGNLIVLNSDIQLVFGRIYSILDIE